MRRALFISGMAICLLSCANGGNGSVNGDSSASTTNAIAPDTRDTVDRGYGAGANGNPATGTNNSNGVDSGRMMTNGAAGEKSSAGSGTGTGGADSSKGGKH